MIDGRRRVLAERGSFIRQDFRVDSVRNFEWLRPDRLLFIVLGRRPFGPDDDVTGLFVYDGESVRLLLLNGDSVPGVPDSPLEDFRSSQPENLQGSGAGSVVLGIEFSSTTVAPPFSRRAGLLLIDQDLQLKLLAPRSEIIGTEADLFVGRDPFHWDDQERLLFGAGFSSGFASSHACAALSRRRFDYACLRAPWPRPQWLAHKPQL